MGALRELPVAAVYDRRRVGGGFGSAPKAFASRYRRKSGSRGAALMLSLWALFLLSAMVISWALDINSRLILSSHANRNLEAEAMACSGAEIALHPNVRPGSPLLRGGFGSNNKFEARITGEGGRLNLKYLLSPPDHSNPRLEVLRKYLEVKGVDLNERDRMIDCLLDWVDPDNLEQLNGAEESPGYKPPNRPLVRLDELKRIKGWEDFTSTENWDADFTLDSKGVIDPVWASRDVLLALPGMTEPFVDQFLTMRRGPDGVEGTPDDPLWTDQQVLEALGYTTPQAKILVAGLIGSGDTTWRIVSVGKSAEITRTVRMVIRKTGNNVQLVQGTWKEL
jgi:general secretion pathway protein K